ncbi:hypothetical protein [Streptomyces sp. NRRL F-2580]|uniref:hypothetical protein n=1 Tax=Streptomyces sp. NRRL F-2580 TaxID=1463841 RepID=UPI000AF887FD|nr:hypothetical protein [Streptomyces sp. NRRL F-2580]
MHERTVDQIPGESWESYAQEEIAGVSEHCPGRDQVAELSAIQIRSKRLSLPSALRGPG